MPRSRHDFFDSLRRDIAACYLAEPDNPYRMSGRSKGAERWEETRRCIALAIDAPGDVMDIGCANGLLLESLLAWSPHRIVPHGIDFVPELIDYAKRRHPNHAANFEVANVWCWKPRRRYDFVRTNLEYVPAEDWPEYLRRVQRAVVPGGRLIVCHYRNADEPPVDVEGVLGEVGMPVADATSAPGVRVAWTA